MNNAPAHPLTEHARQAVARLQEAGFIAYWAGGCVRDMLMEREPRDIDIATNAVPEEVARLFPGAVMVGKAFGVVRAPIGGFFYEVATFRKDHDYRDGRRPTGITFSDPPTDAMRRDFTINAMFYDPVHDRLHDYVHGQEDLAAGIVRCVGEPAARIEEDALRMLRAVRFASTLDFTIHSETLSVIRDCAPRIACVSAERIRDELTRTLLESRTAGAAIRLLDDASLLEQILPEVAATKGQAQPERFHPEGDVFEHTVLMLNLMEERTAALAYAVLLHDIGKPGTVVEAPDRLRFPGHAAQGAELAAGILRRLRFPNRDADTILQCVRNHMRFMDVRKMRRSTLRRMVAAPSFPVELEMHRLDCLASHGDLENYRFLVAFREELAHEPVLPPRWINGRDIMDMGLSEGPRIGKWLARAYDAQLEGRFENREALLEWLENELERDPA